MVNVKLFAPLLGSHSKVIVLLLSSIITPCVHVSSFSGKRSVATLGGVGRGLSSLLLQAMAKIKTTGIRNIFFMSQNFYSSPLSFYQFNHLRNSFILSSQHIGSRRKISNIQLYYSLSVTICVQVH